MIVTANIVDQLRGALPHAVVAVQPTCDHIPTLWVKPERALEVLRYLKLQVDQPYRLLYDLTAIDERVRSHQGDQPASDFTIVYHLLSFERNQDIRIKVGLPENRLVDRFAHAALAGSQLV